MRGGGVTPPSPLSTAGFRTDIERRRNELFSLSANFFQEETDPDGEGDEDVGDNDGDDKDEEQVEKVCRVGPRAPRQPELCVKNTSLKGQSNGRHYFL